MLEQEERIYKLYNKYLSGISVMEQMEGYEDVGIIVNHIGIYKYYSWLQLGIRTISYDILESTLEYHNKLLYEYICGQSSLSEYESESESIYNYVNYIEG